MTTENGPIMGGVSITFSHLKVNVLKIIVKNLFHHVIYYNYTISPKSKHICDP